MAKISEKSKIGLRLEEAFGGLDKAEIAKILGYENAQGVYKVINGDRELSFEKLLRFQNYTKRSIDWLLTGQNGRSFTLAEPLRNRLAAIAQEQAHEIFSDAEIAAGNHLEEKTLELLVEFLLARSLKSAGLIVDETDVMTAANLKRAQRFPFAATEAETLDSRIREMITREISGNRVSQVAQRDELRDMIRELINEQNGTPRLDLVMPIGEKAQIKKTRKG